jgi:hypothetical protein
MPYAPRNLSKFFESSVTEKNLEGSSSEAAAAAAMSAEARAYWSVGGVKDGSDEQGR